MDDKALYQQVADEITSGTIDRALWTKAFAEADGNEGATKARYVKARVAELRSADRATRKAQRPPFSERLKEWLLEHWAWLALIACAVALAGMHKSIETGAWDGTPEIARLSDDFPDVPYERTLVGEEYRYVFTARDGRQYHVPSKVTLMKSEVLRAIAGWNNELIARGLAPAMNPVTPPPTANYPVVRYGSWLALAASLFGHVLGLLLIPGILALISRGRWRLGLAWAGLLIAGFFSTYSAATDHWGKAGAETFHSWMHGIGAVLFLVLLLMFSPQREPDLDPNVHQNWNR